jgi:hypothetical protein
MAEIGKIAARINPLITKFFIVGLLMILNDQIRQKRPL